MRLTAIFRGVLACAAAAAIAASPAAAREAQSTPAQEPRPPAAEEENTSPPPEAKSPADEVEVGHWIEVRGELGEDGIFRGERAELLEPQRREILIGTVSDSDRRRGRFTVLGQLIEVSADTEFGGVDAGALEGRRVKVEGEYRSDHEFVATDVDRRGEGRDRVGGTVDEVRRTAEGVLVRIMHFSVLLPPEVEHAVPLEALARTAAGDLAGSGGYDEDDLFGRGLRLGETARLSGQVQFDTGGEENFDLDRRDAEDRREQEGAARLRLQWSPGPLVFAVAELRAGRRYRDDEEDGASTRDQARLGETFLYLRDPFRSGLDLELGRQDFDDEREWLYDENLDGLRLIQRFAGMRLELSATTKFSDGSPRDENSTNWIGYLARERGDRHLALWVLRRRVGGAPGDRPTHVGVRWLEDDSWIDVAYVTGKLAGRNVGGWGFDAGRTFEPGSFGPFSFTLAYAFGSGGGRDGGTDRTFRQTGYQDNNARFGGVTSFRYYGELADVELANLHIATLGLGARLARRTSLDLVGHYYRQDEPRAQLFGAEIDDRPDGIHRELGWEADLIYGDRRWARWDIEAVAAYFAPGAAFQGADRAYLARVQLRFRF